MKTLAGFIMGFVTGFVGVIGALALIAAAEEGGLELRLGGKPANTEREKKTAADAKDKNPIGFARDWNNKDS